MVSNCHFLNTSIKELKYQYSSKLGLFVIDSSSLNCNTRFPKPGVASSNLAEAAFINYIYIGISGINLST